MPAKLVAIGDSMTHGFQSGSISRTDLSYPAMIAQCLDDTANFNFPDFKGQDGLPLNLEALVRRLSKRYGGKLSLLKVVPAALTVQSFMDQVEDYWERGDGSLPSNTGPLHRNLAVFGFQLGDCDTLTEELCRRSIPLAKDDLVSQIPEYSMYRAARRTLNPSFTSDFKELSQVVAAKQIASQSGGIENLIFWLGANNCLGTVIDLKIRWSEEADLYRFSHQRTCNLWLPSHFRKLLERIAPKIVDIGAQNVFVGTIPHVTIPPVSRGITPNASDGAELSEDGYYEFYTHFWVWDDDFSRTPHQYPYLTRDEARQIDSVIDEYNEELKDQAEKHGWYIVDLCSKLDQLAFRRQQGKPTYTFPQPLVDALKSNPGTQNRFTEDDRPILDTRYLRFDSKEGQLENRFKGGIVSLDGIHPTTIAYGLIAHEFLEIMTKKGVTQVHPLDWNSIVASDSLVTNLPPNLANLQDTLGFLYSQGVLRSTLQALRGEK